MSFIRLHDFAPPARFTPDDDPWTKYTLESSVDGITWASFEDTAVLDPAVTDPANPPTYAFASNDAPDDAVYFRVVWSDEQGISVPTTAVIRPYPMPAWAPSLGDVAAFITARTKMPGNGVYANTFNEKTHPTNLQVEMYIAKAVEDVIPLAGRVISDPDEANTVKNLAAMRAAMLVELNFFASQVNSDQSPYDRYKQIWDDETGSDTAGGEGGGDSVLGTRAPSFSFARYATLMDPLSITVENDVALGYRAPGADGYPA